MEVKLELELELQSSNKDETSQTRGVTVDNEVY